MAETFQPTEQDITEEALEFEPYERERIEGSVAHVEWLMRMRRRTPLSIAFESLTLAMSRCGATGNPGTLEALRVLERAVDGAIESHFSLDTKFQVAEHQLAERNRELQEYTTQQSTR